MADILTAIEAYKRDEIAAAKRERPLAEITLAAKAAPAPRGFLAAIERRLKAGGYALIAEIKKASPSKGTIRDASRPPSSRAPMRRAARRVCRCSQTRPRSRAAPNTACRARGGALPALRKDFMYDPYQVAEAAHGAPTASSSSWRRSMMRRRQRSKMRPSISAWTCFLKFMMRMSWRARCGFARALSASTIAILRLSKPRWRRASAWRQEFRRGVSSSAKAACPHPTISRGSRAQVLQLFSSARA